MNMQDFDKMSFIHAAKTQDGDAEIEIMLFEWDDKLYMVDVDGKRYKQSLDPDSGSSEHYSDWIAFS